MDFKNIKTLKNLTFISIVTNEVWWLFDILKLNPMFSTDLQFQIDFLFSFLPLNLIENLLFLFDFP